MSNQQVGHYTSGKDRLLKDFDRTYALVEDRLVNQFGSDFTTTMYRDVRQEYETLIPKIPYVPGRRARMLNIFLLITAQEVAAYRAFKKHGKSPEFAWGVCHQALRLRAAEVPSWKKWLFRTLMFSSISRKIFAIRMRQQQRTSFGDFQVEYLVGKGGDFDLGINYLKCGNHRFAMQHGGEAFAPYICMSDIALSDAMGWGLIRTQSLADGCAYCDFRFKKGVATQISSKTPEVQIAIEKIREREAEQERAAVATSTQSAETNL